MAPANSVGSRLSFLLLSVDGVGGAKMAITP